MTWLRTLLAGLAASMARDEAGAVHAHAHTPVLAEPREKAASAPMRDPLAEEDQVLEAQP